MAAGHVHRPFQALCLDHRLSYSGGTSEQSAQGQGTGWEIQVGKHACVLEGNTLGELHSFWMKTLPDWVRSHQVPPKSRCGMPRSFTSQHSILTLVSCRIWLGECLSKFLEEWSSQLACSSSTGDFCFLRHSIIDLSHNANLFFFPTRTTGAVVLWQWINQSFNALVNYTNRNAASSLSNKWANSPSSYLVLFIHVILFSFLRQIAVAYITATSSALATALGFKALLSTVSLVLCIVQISLRFIFIPPHSTESPSSGSALCAFHGCGCR